MASLFRPSYTKTNADSNETELRYSRKWYGRYRDANGVWQKVPLCEDKDAAQAMLTDILRNIERRKAGLIDATTENVQQQISHYSEEYRKSLTAKARSKRHIEDTIRTITSVTQACCMKTILELINGTSAIENYISSRQATDCSYRTINADIVAVRSFCNWLIARKIIRDDPTSSLELLNVEERRRHERRPLTDDESQRLLEVTSKSETVFRSLSGTDRKVIYLLAQRTGLRVGEINSLTPQSFDLSDENPTVRVKAADSKRRKKDILPLAQELLNEMREYLPKREQNTLIWKGSWWRRSAEMLQDDLKAAGIQPVDSQGLILDFHSLRMTFITGLARAGVSPAMAQRLARHSDINLTMGVYTKLDSSELATAIAKLPALNTKRTTATAIATPDTVTQSNVTSDQNLHLLIDRWQELPEYIRLAIMALVKGEID